MDQPQITPGLNGYMAPLPAVEYGENPWAIAAGKSELAAQEGTAQGMSKISDMSTKLNGLYPTYSNSQGLGTGNFGQAPKAAPPADGGSRSMNPWSLQGEAMSR